MPRRRRFQGLTRPKTVNILIPGLGEVLGRSSDRLRVSSGVFEAKAYEARVAMFRDLGRRLLFDILRARIERRFSTDELYQAYLRGEGALSALLKRHAGRALWPLYQQWKKEYRKRDRAKTFRRIERFLDAHGGKEATTACLTAANVAAFLAERVAGNRTEKTPASGATLNRDRAAIGVFATHLVRRGLLAVHPIAFKAVPKAEEADPRVPPPFEPEEYEQYFDAILGERADVAVVFRMLIHTGGDVEEVLSRTVRDVDLARGLVHYKRSKTKTPARQVPMDAVLVAELRGHIASWSLSPGDKLFGMFERPPIERLHAKAKLAVARPELRLKDLRHLAAIAWVQSGVPITVVSQYLGHATLGQTMIYARYAPADAEQARHAERAAEAMRGSSKVQRLRRAARKEA